MILFQIPAMPSSREGWKLIVAGGRCFCFGLARQSRLQPQWTRIHMEIWGGAAAKTAWRLEFCQEGSSSDSQLALFTVSRNEKIIKIENSAFDTLTDLFP